MEVLTSLYKSSVMCGTVIIKGFLSAHGMSKASGNGQRGLMEL